MHQVGEARRLGEDVAAVFALPAHELHGLGVGADDGQGGFQLVARVGDEAALPLHVLRHGTDGQTAQGPHQQQHGKPGGDPAQPGEGGHPQKLMGLAAHVQENHGPGLRRGLDHPKAESADPAAGFAGIQRLPGVSGGILFAEIGNAAEIRAHKGPFPIKADGKGQRAHPIPGVGAAAEEPVLPVRPQKFVPGRGTEILLGGQGAQQRLPVPDDGENVEEVDAAQQQHQQHRDRDHGGDGEFFLQRPDHLDSSSV